MFNIMVCCNLLNGLPSLFLLLLRLLLFLSICKASKGLKFFTGGASPGLAVVGFSLSYNYPRLRLDLELIAYTKFVAIKFLSEFGI